jgi:hypothetical protein
MPPVQPNRKRTAWTAVGFTLLGLLLFVGAGLLAFMQPVNVIRCAPDGRCRIERWVAGLFFLFAEELPRVRGVTVSQKSESYRSDNRNRSVVRETLILQSPAGAIETDGTQFIPLGWDSRRIAMELERFLSARERGRPAGGAFGEDDAGHFSAWQGEAALLVIAALLPLLGLWSLRAAGRRLLRAIKGG